MSKMERANLRAPRASMKMWRARAKASGMTLSEWLRRVADDGPIYQTTVTPTEPEDTSP